MTLRLCLPCWAAEGCPARPATVCSQEGLSWAHELAGTPFLASPAPTLHSPPQLSLTRSRAQKRGKEQSEDPQGGYRGSDPDAAATARRVRSPCSLRQHCSHACAASKAYLCAGLLVQRKFAAPSGQVGGGAAGGHGAGTGQAAVRCCGCCCCCLWPCSCLPTRMLLSEAVDLYPAQAGSRSPLQPRSAQVRHITASSSSLPPCGVNITGPMLRCISLSTCRPPSPLAWGSPGAVLSSASPGAR